MGLAWRPVMFSWLRELVPVFWLMELDLICLKGSGMSSSRSWGVCGFGVSLGSPSGFGNVRHVYFFSHFKVDLSAYLHCHQPPTCPWNHCWCFCSPVPPYIEGQSMLGRGLCGSFLGFPTLPSVSRRLVWTSLSPLSSPSASQGLCALALAPWTLPLHQGAYVFFFWLPSSSVPHGLCALERLLFPCLRSPGLISVPQGCVLWRSLYATPLLTLQAHPLNCRASLGFLLFPEPTVWSESQTMAEKCSFACFLPSESLLCPAFWDSAAPLWAPLWGNFSVHGELLFQDSFPPLGHKLLSRSSTSFPFLCFHPLSHLISRSLACPPGGLGSSVVA